MSDDPSFDLESPTSLGGDLPGSPPLELSNEYATVTVREVQTGNGVRLEIVAPRVGRGVRLCPLQLESLTWQTSETFSSFLRTPFGPEGTVER